jgi:hypothetical protein
MGENLKKKKEISFYIFCFFEINQQTNSKTTEQSLFLNRAEEIKLRFSILIFHHRRSLAYELKENDQVQYNIDIERKKKKYGTHSNLFTTTLKNIIIIILI